MLYLKSDVLILTGIFQNVRDTDEEAFAINPI